MNCVSYTRATSCDPKRSDNPAPIMEQNACIKDFIRRRKWKLTGHYSDRKHDPGCDSAFLEMREDGVNRKFDCVVTSSLWQCGKDVFQAVMLFRKTFYPAGIHFAVAEDDFCSAEHEQDQVEAYLQEAWARYHGRDTGERLGIYTVIKHLTMFGYIYNKETNTLRIDKDSAAIVKEIFERTAAGERPGIIAKDLTKRQIETPSEYFVRLQHDHGRIVTSTWTTVMIHNIAKNPKYCGRWERVLYGKDLAAEVGCIVTPALFDEAQNQIAKRDYGKNQRPTKPTPLAGRMWDKESGMPLVKYSNALREISDIRFRYPKEKEIFYDKISMDYQEFMQRVEKELRREKQECLNVYENLHSDHGKRFIDKKLATLRAPVPDILRRMGEVENKKMSCYEEFREGLIPELTYKKKKGAYMKQLAALDDELEGILKEMDEINKFYSDSNPWIMLYRYMDENAALTRKHAIRYIEKILVYRFESIEMIPYHNEWKRAFPAEWLTGGADGKEE